MESNEIEVVRAGGSRYLEARSSLPEELRSVYQRLVEEYRFHALQRYGRAWVSYDVIADLVRSDWRPTEEQTTVAVPAATHF